MGKISAITFLVFSCRIPITPLPIAVTSEAWIDAADAWAEYTGREVRVTFLGSIADLPNLSPKPDLILGPGLAPLASQSRDLRGVLSRSGLEPGEFRKGLFETDGWDYPVRLLPLALSAPLVLTRESATKPDRVSGAAEWEALLAGATARRGGMGFSPWWNPGLAISLLSMDGQDPESWKTWSRERHAGRDLDFLTEIHSLLPLQELREGKIGAWVVSAQRWAQLTVQDRQGISFQPLRVGQSLPLLPETHWAVVPEGAGGGGKDVLAWLLGEGHLHQLLQNSPLPSITVLIGAVEGPWPDALPPFPGDVLYLPPEGPGADDVAALFRGELDAQKFREKFVLTEYRVPLSIRE